MWALGAFPCLLSLVCTFFVAGLDMSLSSPIESSKHGGIQEELRSGSQQSGSTFVDIMRGVTSFSFIYWTLTAFMITFFASSQVWSNFATDIFVERFHMHADDAGWTNSISTIICVVFAPIFGFAVDLFDRHLSMCLVGSGLLATGHLITLVLSYSVTAEVLCVVSVGLGMGMVQASLWPMLATSVPASHVTTAMGIAAAMQNAGMVLFPFVAGYIHDRFGGYRGPVVMFLGQDLICCAIIFTLQLYLQAKPEDVLKK